MKQACQKSDLLLYDQTQRFLVLPLQLEELISTRKLIFNLFIKRGCAIAPTGITIQAKYFYSLETGIV